MSLAQKLETEEKVSQAYSFSLFPVFMLSYANSLLSLAHIYSRPIEMRGVSSLPN